MKLLHAGDKSKAICYHCNALVHTTYQRRDIPFSDGVGIATDILAGVCDVCDRVVSTPAQSTPAIKASRDKAMVPVEAQLPAIYMDALDLACYRIDSSVSSDFRKRLLMYYVGKSSKSSAWSDRLVAALKNKVEFELPAESARKRLSIKVSKPMADEIAAVMAVTKLSKTDLMKSIVLQINEDIIKPKMPKNFEELRTLALIANC
ncbi:UNVERIFIED_ORG: hypothetical protein JN05_04892 [Zoogloea ramigera]|uniref:Uncharacterized protein n=1 Tax=Duganella zoogloeoides TaxID=75659 RepID=A0ABZ0Y6A5_9BURK|nr:hypothetical protein [Duganella zoogloeoides]WQH07374.1 hypothetical protein SR858_13850 [Duganella zoogloeoides]